MRLPHVYRPGTHPVHNHGPSAAPLRRQRRAVPGVEAREQVRGLAPERGVPGPLHHRDGRDVVGDLALRDALAVVERVAHELGSPAAAQLALDVRQVRLDRPDGKREPLSDLGVRVPERDQAQDVAFARRQLAAAAPAGRELADVRGDVPLARGHAPHRLDELGVRRLLEHVAARPEAQGAAGERGVVLHGQDDDPGGGDVAADAQLGADRLADDGVRALIGAFAQGNVTQFNRPDGAGYDFIADTILTLDPKNPQLAARMATAFRTWRTLEAGRQAKAEAALTRIKSTSGLSRDLADIVERALAPV